MRLQTWARQARVWKKPAYQLWEGVRWQENQKKIEKFWQELEAEVDGLGLDMEKLRIYQDGLPCAGALGERIVRETAAKRQQELPDCAKAHGQGRQD